MSSIYLSRTGVRVANKRRKGDLEITYLPNERDENDEVRRAKFIEDISERTDEILRAFSNVNNASDEEMSDGDTLLLLKWNDAGLQARIPTAAAAGLRTSGGALVASVADMKDAISNILISPPAASTDLGGHNDLFQFLPLFRYSRKLTILTVAHTYLRRRAQGFAGAPANAQQWPDIVEYAQEITITRANAAVGPVDVVHLFNL